MNLEKGRQRARPAESARMTKEMTSSVKDDIFRPHVRYKNALTTHRTNIPWIRYMRFRSEEVRSTRFAARPLSALPAKCPMPSMSTIAGRPTSSASTSVR